MPDPLLSDLIPDGVVKNGMWKSRTSDGTAIPGRNSSLFAFKSTIGCVNIDPMRRYNALSDYLKRTFGEKVYRVSIDAGFTCPNRDGRLATGGCIFCDEAGSRARYVEPELPVREQLRRGIEFVRRKFGARKFIAYFQAYSNTYAPVEKLREIYSVVFEFPEVVGLSVSTRPDLVPDAVLDLLAEFAERLHVWLELGVQSFHYRSLVKVRRYHGVAESIDAILRAHSHGLDVVAHMILGLPGETELEIVENARILSALGVHGVKMHHLYVVKGTPLEKIYRAGNLKVYETPEDYARVAAKFIAHLSPEIVIHRLAGRAPSDMLVAPKWSSNKFAPIQAIEKELEEKDLYQGKLLRIGIGEI